MVSQRLGSQVVTVERSGSAGRVLIICEHAARDIPPEFGTLGLTEDQRSAHIAWDPGALGLARGLARRLDAALVRAGVSRLVYDLNRPPGAAGAMAAQSEIHAIPGNRTLSPDQRLRRTREVYLRFHRRLQEEVAGRLAQGRLDALITVHSFTPVWHGRPRRVELGVIHDRDDRLARAVLHHAQLMTGMIAALNEPYSAADGVTHTLALHATPMGLPHAMLEIRSDLIAGAAAEKAMAERLAPVLRAAIAEVTEVPCPAG